MPTSAIVRHAVAMTESARCGAIRRYLPIEQTGRADSLSKPLLGGDAECADDSEDLAGPFREVIRSRDSAATRMQRGRWSGRLRVPGAFDDNADFKDRGCAAACGSFLRPGAVGMRFDAD